MECAAWIGGVAVLADGRCGMKDGRQAARRAETVLWIPITRRLACVKEAVKEAFFGERYCFGDTVCRCDVGGGCGDIG